MKPADISQDHYQDAAKVYNESKAWASNSIDLIEDIARAIQRAVEREREACAGVVERFPQFVGLSDAEVEETGMFVAPTSREDIAAAIRARGEV